jgi:hypothetical protein
MKVYLITETEMTALRERLELAAMAQANILGQKWNTVAERAKDETQPTADDFKYSAYEVWRGLNFVVCRWMSEMGR